MDEFYRRKTNQMSYVSNNTFVGVDSSVIVTEIYLAYTRLKNIY